MADPVIPDPAAVDAANASLSALNDTTGRYADSSLRAAENASKVKSSLEVTTNVAKAANSAFSGLDDISKSVSNQFKDYGVVLNNAGVSVSNMNQLSEQQTKALGAVSVALLGVQRQFRNLGDNSSVQTFEKTIMSLKDTAENKGALLGVVSNLADKMGQKLPDGIGNSIGLLKNFALNMLASSDNAMLAQNAFIQMSSAAGNLNDIYKAAGPNLENVSKIMDQQIDKINNSAKALGLTGEEVNKYWSQLGKIPGALNAVIKGTSNSAESLDNLTASIALARGSGRTYEAVINDLSNVYKNFGATGNDAFKIIGNIGDIANRTGVNFETIHSALMGSSSALKEFSDGGKSAGDTMMGLSSIMVNYVDGLKKTGLSADTSIGIIKNMTDQIGKLSTAQKSFLSAQTGGAGGLMGANQIDMMIRNGQIEKVFDKIRSQMQKQFGSIVTQQEAAQSEFAARQFEKQKLLLQKGPLGSLVQNDQQAARLLESFRGRQEGKNVPINLKDQSLSVVDKGIQLQSQGNNILTRIAVGVEAGKRSMDSINNQTIQGALNSGSMKENLNELSNKDMNLGAAGAMQGRITERTGTFDTNMINQNILGNLKDTGKTIMELPKVMGNIINETRNKEEPGYNIKNDPRIQNQRSRNIIVNQINKNNENSKLNENMIPQINDNLKTAVSNTSQVVGNIQPKREDVVSQKENKVLNSSLGEINVHVQGYCVRCQNEIVGGDQMASVSPAAKQTP